MAADKKYPNCFGGMLTGNAYAERCCDDCFHKDRCQDETNHQAAEWKKNKPKEIDPAWIDNAIDLMIGPHLAIIYHKMPVVADELKRLIHGAVASDWSHGVDKWVNTNEWVKYACERIWDLYNTYMTAKLMDQFDNGVPDVGGRIIVPKSGSGIH